MSNRKFYTDKDYHKQFPEPGVPAEEAWKQMHELLVENDLTKPDKKDKRRRLTVFFILLCLLIGAGIIYMFTAQKDPGKSNKASINNNDNNVKSNRSDTSDIIAQQHFTDTLLQQQPNLLSSIHKLSQKDQQQDIPPELSSTNNNSNSINNDISISKPGDTVLQQQTETNEIIAEAPVSSAIKSDDKSEVKDSIEKNDTADQFSLKKANSKKQKPGKFHFGLEWNINFSTVNNSHYFEAYNGGKQYYMWLLPSAWAKMDIGEKHGIALHVNPYNQQFAGKQTTHIEKPMIASIEPDVITKLIKSRGYNIGADYEYNAAKKLTIAAGLNYTIQNKALYAQEEVIAFSGEIVSDSIKAAGKNDAAFKYLKPAYLSWDASAKYNFKKISIGAGVTKPITNMSSNPGFSVRPLNGRIYLQYRFK